jgi:hypothetical protein
MTAASEFTIGTHVGPIALGAAQNTTLNGSGIAVAWVVQAESSGAISKIRFRYGTRTGTPPTYVLTIEGLDTSGNPDATDKGGGSPTATTFTPPADTSWDNTIQEITLTNSYTPANAGEVLCFTLRYSSGTADGSNNSSVTRGFSNAVAVNRGFPYNQSLSAGTWTKNAQAACLAWLVGASSWHGHPVLATYTTATASTAGHRSAMFITLPSGFGTTFALAGVHFIGKFGAAAGSTKLAIWDDSDTELVSKTIDADWVVSPGTATNGLRLFFDSPLTLSYGTKYYIGLEVVSGTVGIAGISGQSSDDIACYPNGTTRGLATYNGTTWTESALTYPLMDLILSDITVPSGSGGGAVVIGGLGQTGIGSF